MEWTAETVPQVLLDIVSSAAGKDHKQGGAVAKNLADVLNAYDNMDDFEKCVFPSCQCNMNHPWPGCCEMAGKGD